MGSLRRRRITRSAVSGSGRPRGQRGQAPIRGTSTSPEAAEGRTPEIEGFRRLTRRARRSAANAENTALAVAPAPDSEPALPAPPRERLARLAVPQYPSKGHVEAHGMGCLECSQAFHE